MIASAAVGCNAELDRPDRAAAFCNRKSNVLRVMIRCDQRLEERQEFVSRHLRGSVDREIRAAGPLKLVEDRVSHPHVLAQGESSHRLSPHINVAIGKSLNQCIAQHRSINCRERTQRKCRPVPDVRIVIFRLLVSVFLVLLGLQIIVLMSQLVPC